MAGGCAADGQADEEGVGGVHGEVSRDGVSGDSGRDGIRWWGIATSNADSYLPRDVHVNSTKQLDIKEVLDISRNYNIMISGDSMAISFFKI